VRRSSFTFWGRLVYARDK